MQRFIKLIIASIATIHICMTILYLLPVNPISKEYQQYVHKYMNTLFRQDWKLFSPEPALYSLKMFYTCQAKDLHSTETHWKDPLINLVRSHQQNRLSFAGKRIYVYQGMYRQVLNKKSRIQNQLKCENDDLACAAKLKKKVIQSKEFIHINRFVSALCLAEGENQPHRFKLIKTYPIPFSQRNNPRAKPVNTIEFDSEVVYAAY
jgi:hypothetical protein